MALLERPETEEEAQARYQAAAHAMQTGVAAKMGYSPTETLPKHLRVGVNSAHVSHAALVELLVAKGVITNGEYLSALADAMERERDHYQAAINRHFGPDGPKITLA